MKNIPPAGVRISALIVLLTLSGSLPSSQAASASWNPSPFNNNWIAAPTTNNWSTGAGTFPGATSGTSSSDIATFNTNSSITTVNCASALAISGIVFDTTNAAAYTINTSVGTWRVVGSGIHVTGTCTNKETINGQLRMASSGTLYVISDSIKPSATLNINGGISVNNSGNFGTLILSGTNTGPNIMGAYTEQTPATICGNLIKTNTGLWILTGNNTYHSNTFVLGGTLELMGSGAIPNSSNLVVNSGTLIVSNTMSNPNNMWVTNFGTLALTNTTVSQSPLTIGTLTTSNATFQLGVNGSSPYTDITVSTALNAGPNINLAISRVVNVTGVAGFTLISYAGADPNPANFTVTVPTGYSASPLSVGGGVVNVTITPPSSIPLVWVGATNSVLVSNWDTNKTKDWVDQTSTPQFYANPDSVTFDDTAVNSLVTVLTTNTPNSFTFNNSMLNYRINGPGKVSGTVGLTQEGSATNTLADNGDDFSGGIAVQSGTLILDNTNGNISGGLTISSGAIVQIGNNDPNGALPAGTLDDEGTLVFQRVNNLTLSAPIPGGGIVIQNGSGTLTMTTTNTYTGITVASLGTLALTGGGAISNSPGLLVSNATFDVSGIAGTTLLNDFSITNARITLSTTNVFPPLIVNTFEVDGILAISNIINLTTVPGIASYPVTFPIIKSANAINLVNGNFNFALGSLPLGATGYLSESADDTTILLTLNSGPTGQRSSITWIGVDNTSATTNWSDGLNWQFPGAPTPPDTLFFDSSTTVASAATVNNVLNASFTVASLTYDNINGQYHVTQIPANTVLTVNNTFTVGNEVADNAVTHVAFVDAGTLIVNATNANLVGNSGVLSSSGNASLDLSGLSNFVYNAGSSTFGVGNLGGRGLGTLTLASASNNITAGTVAIMTSSGSSSVSATTTLGTGTNLLNANTINLGATRSSGTLQFNPANPAGGLRLRGTAGTDASRATMVLGNRSAGGSSGTSGGTLSLNGHPVDLKVSTLTLGQCNQVSPVAGNGVVAFDTGTMDASNILMAVNSNTGTANGAVTVGANATLVVGLGGISLVDQTSTGAATGSLTNNNGMVICSNSIVKTTAAGTANVTLTGGTLNMVAGMIGTLAAPIDNLTLNGGSTLQLNVIAGATNIAAANITASGLTTINIASVLTTIGGPQQIPLIYYTGTDPTTAGLAVGTVPAGYSNASLVDDGAGHISLVITAPAELVWVGAVGSVLNSSWNTSTLNWNNSGSPAAYADGDFLQFDDTASNSVVTLAGTVLPAGLDVTNNALNYTFDGPGNISGSVRLLKQGPGTLILDNSGINNFSGNVNLVGGILQIGNNDANGNLPGSVTNNGTLAFDRTDNLTFANVISESGTLMQIGPGTVTLGGTNSSFTGKVVVTNGILNTTAATGLGAAPATLVVTNGGTFDDNGLAFNGAAALRLTISGPGFNGIGAIVNSGAQQISAFSNITVAANVALGGTNRWDLRASTGSAASLNVSPANSPYSITKVGTNQIALVNVGTVDAGLGNIYVQQGEFAVQEGTAQLGNPASNLVVSAGATLETFSLGPPLNKVITLNGDGANDSFRSDSGGAADNIVNGPVTLNGNCLFDIASNVFATVGGVINGSGGLTKITQGTLTLTNVNTYTGNTTISNGVLVLSGSGSLASPNIVIAAGATLNASQRTDQTLTLNTGQTLSGFGTVTGIVSAVSGSTIAPGSATAIGTLTFSNNVTLGGANAMKVTHAATATNDVLNVVNGSLTLGGALNVSLLGNSFVAGDSFKLYTAPGGLGGTFSATNLPALPSGLGWVSTNLVNGILSIVATVNLNPTNITASVSGGTLTLSWPADHTGWVLQVQTNSLAAGLNTAANAWTTLPGSGSLNTNIITMDPTQGAIFYRLAPPQ